jgi:uroporphyrinogen III methyltransferase/synthase
MTAKLTGLRVWVTRPASSAAASVQMWQRAGADAVAVSLVRFSPRPLSSGDARRLTALPRPWTVVLTSQNAVRFLADAVASHPELAAAWKTAVAYAVGETTASRARALGVTVAGIAPRATGEDLASMLRSRLTPGQNVVLPGSDRQRPQVRDALVAAGIDVTSLVVYHTLPVSSLERTLAAELTSAPGPVIVLYSPSAVHALREILAADGPPADQVRTAVVGPTTAEAARSAGLQVVASPERPGEASLVESVIAWWRGRPS